MQFARKTRLLAREKQPLPSAPARPRHLPPIHRILGPLADVMVAVFEEEGAAIEHRALPARDRREFRVRIHRLLGGMKHVAEALPPPPRQDRQGKNVVHVVVVRRHHVVPRPPTGRPGRSQPFVPGPRSFKVV